MDLMDYVKELFDIGFVLVKNEHSELFNGGIYDDYLALKIVCMENTTTDVYIAFDPDTFEPKGYEIFGFFIDKKMFLQKKMLRINRNLTRFYPWIRYHRI